MWSKTWYFVGPIFGGVTGGVTGWVLNRSGDDAMSALSEWLQSTAGTATIVTLACTIASGVYSVWRERVCRAELASIEARAADELASTKAQAADELASTKAAHEQHVVVAQERSAAQAIAEQQTVLVGDVRLVYGADAEVQMQAIVAVGPTLPGSRVKDVHVRAVWEDDEFPFDVPLRHADLPDWSTPVFVLEAPVPVSALARWKEKRDQGFDVGVRVRASCQVHHGAAEPQPASCDRRAYVRGVGLIRP